MTEPTGNTSSAQRLCVTESVTVQIADFLNNKEDFLQMKKFLDENFLLENETAVRLYHEVAKKQPIADYHCHLDAREIYENRRFENLTQIWLGADHYKWRIMRSNGVAEEYITGDASDREKFQKFAETLPRCIGNPMYHWCHLELKNYFGYEGVLNADTAQEVWNIAERKLKENDFCAQMLIKRSNVAMIGTTDDPTSDLKYHGLLKSSGFETKVLPSFRPDPALNIHKPGFVQYIEKLSASVGMSITTAEDVITALLSRIEFFDIMGCRSADHGLDYVMYRRAPLCELNQIFQKALDGQNLTTPEIEAYQTELLLACAREYSKRGWVMQIHFSCKRNPNTKRFNELGPDSGFDCIAVTDSSSALYSLMDALDSEQALPKTILYSLNPADDEWLDTLLGAFQGEGVRGKIQHGSAWWFNDNKTGMLKQLTSLANLSILGNFVGMLTDSRSFLSYARHEYFRRILCNFIGTLVENGEYPDDYSALEELTKDICYKNAENYFCL